MLTSREAIISSSSNKSVSVEIISQKFEHIELAFLFLLAKDFPVEMFEKLTHAVLSPSTVIVTVREKELQKTRQKYQSVLSCVYQWLRVQAPESEIVVFGIEKSSPWAAELASSQKADHLILSWMEDLSKAKLNAIKASLGEFGGTYWQVDGFGGQRSAIQLDRVYGSTLSSVEAGNRRRYGFKKNIPQLGKVFRDWVEKYGEKGMEKKLLEFFDFLPVEE